MLRANKTLLAATAATLALLFAGASIAEAKPRKHQSSRELTVKKRPFTDSGTKVNVGTESRYVGDTHYNGTNSTLGRAPNSYGGETLPGRFELPGR